jgi:hypothetical protein
MPFSGHRSLGGVASYQTFTLEIMHETVFLIIPNDNSFEDSENNKMKNETRTPLAPLPVNLKSSSYISAEKRNSQTKPHDWSRPFKVPRRIISQQTSSN